MENGIKNGANAAVATEGKTKKNGAFKSFSSAIALSAFTAFAGIAHAQNLQVDSIVVQGNQRIEQSTILTYLGIERGQEVTGGQINGALQNLRDAGVFEDVEIDTNGNTLVVKVTEFPTVNQISFEGNRRLDDDTLSGLVETSPRRVFNPAQAERDAALIAEAYAAQGRISSKVEPRIIRREDNRVDVVFEISEGTVIEVERIAIVGNKAYSERRLRQVLATKQAGFLRTVIGSDTLVEDRIAVDGQLLEDFYQSRGYVDFRISSTDVQLSRERDAYYIVFNVQEGSQYKVGTVTTTSQINGLDAAAYQEALRIKPGVVYSPTLIEESVARQERLGIRQGQDFLRVRPVVEKNPETLTLDVNFVLEQGPKIFIERIDIEGNTTTLDRVVRQQFNAAEGDPLNPREISQTANRIRALGYFETVDVDTREGSSPSQRIIDVDVTERPTGSLNLGGAYSVTDGFGVVIGLSEANFLGRGQRVSLDISTAQESESYSIGFTEPYLLGRNLRFSIDAGIAGQNSSFLNYDTRRDFFLPSLSFPVSESGRVTLSYFFEDKEMENRDDDVVGDIVQDEIDRGKLADSGFGLRYTYDTRLTGLNPNSGVRVSVGADFAGVGGDNQFIKPEINVTGQSRILNEEVVIRASLDAGYLIWQSDFATRSVDRYFLTPSRFRGFEPGGVGPRNIGPGYDDPLGGNIFTVAQLEAEFPLPLPEEIGMRGGVFYDIGNLWNLDDADLTGGGSIVGESGSWRHVIGLSLLWTTPIGPLRFNFSKALIKEDFDEEQPFDLTVQATF